MAKRKETTDTPESVAVVEQTREKPVIYIFLNKSLGMSVGKAAAQAAHAAVFATAESDESKQQLWRVNPHKTIIVLEARDENHIRNITTYLAQRGFTANTIVDEGVNEIDPHTITALSSNIVDKDDPHVAETFSTFNLYRDTVRLTIEVDK